MAARVKDNDLGWSRLASALEEAKRLEVVVGWPGGAGASNLELAAIHEFGTRDGRIPERAPLRRGLERGRGRVGVALEAGAKAILGGSGSVQKALGQAGAVAAAEVKSAIRAGLEPALKPATVARKGSSTPLVDTGQLINSVTWAVRPKGGR